MSSSRAKGLKLAVTTISNMSRIYSYFPFTLLFCVAALKAEVTNVLCTRSNFLVHEWLFPVEVGSTEWLQMGIANTSFLVIHPCATLVLHLCSMYRGVHHMLLPTKIYSES